MHELIAELERGTARRPVTIAIAAGMATGVAGVVVHQATANTSDPCGNGQAVIEEVWSPRARAELSAAFSRSNRRLGDEAFAVTAGHIDEYSTRWRRQFDEACRATWQRGEQSETRLRSRLACLRRQVHGLDAVVALLEEPDPSLVQRAPEIVLSLASPTDCSDPRRLPLAEELPVEAEQAARFDEVRRLVTRARTRQAAGRYEEAQLELESLYRSLGPWATPGLKAEVALGLGEAHNDMGEHHRAVTTFEDAAEFARLSGDARLEARAWMDLARTHGQRLRDLPRGEFYLELASACLDTQGRDDPFAATLALTRGRIAFAAGHDDDAHAALTDAIALREGLYGPDDYRVAEVRALLAGAQMRRGELPQARHSLLDALASYERVFGTRHTRVASVHGNLGFVLAGLGEFEEAIHHVRVGRSILLDTFGPNHRAIATADDTLGELFRRSERLREAVPRFESSIRAFERIDGDQSPDLVSPLMGLADTEIALGHPRRALGLLERARELGRDLSLPPIQWGDMHLSLAEAHAALGQTDAAAEALEATADPYEKLDHRDDRRDRIKAVRDTLDR